MLYCIILVTHWRCESMLPIPSPQSNYLFGRVHQRRFPLDINLSGAENGLTRDLTDPGPTIYVLPAIQEQTVVWPDPAQAYSEGGRSSGLPFCSLHQRSVKRSRRSVHSAFAASIETSRMSFQYRIIRLANHPAAYLPFASKYLSTNKTPMQAGDVRPLLPSC
jgi:hypothetical protein